MIGCALILPLADAVGHALPLTPSIRRILDAGRPAILQTHALVVNVERGSLVAEAPRAGRLGGFVAVVFAMEDSAFAQFRCRVIRHLGTGRLGQ